MNNHYGMAGSPPERPRGAAPSRASVRASTPNRCTPRATTFTIHWPWPTPYGASGKYSWRARAVLLGHRNLSNKKQSAGTHLRTPPVTVPRKDKSRSGLHAYSILAYGKRLTDAHVFSQEELDTRAPRRETLVFEMFKMGLGPGEVSAADDGLRAGTCLGHVLQPQCGRIERFDNRNRGRSRQESADTADTRKIRTPLFEGKPVPKMKAFNVRDAIFRGAASPVRHRPDHEASAKRTRLGRRVLPSLAD